VKTVLANIPLSDLQTSVFMFSPSLMRGRQAMAQVLAITTRFATLNLAPIAHTHAPAAGAAVREASWSGRQPSAVRA